jgi:4-amino-4-deoxy-L-arabinose transferase-like glycosyltransferase
MNASTDDTVRPSPASGGLGLIALIAFAAFTCLLGINRGPALGDHECINAQAARQIRQSGEWLIPHLGEIPRIRKTPLGIWLIAATSRIVDDPNAPPVTAFSARLPSAVAAFGTTFVLYWLGTMMYGRRAGLMAGFAWAASVAAIMFARNAQVDMVLTFFTALSFACFWAGFVRGASGPNQERAGMPAVQQNGRPGNAASGWAVIGFFAAFAMAMMSKAPLPAVTVGFTLFVYWFVTVPVLAAADGALHDRRGISQRFIADVVQQIKRLPVVWILLGTAVFAIIAGAWPAYVYKHVPNALSLWRAEYIDRATGDLSEQKESFYYYIPMVLGFAAPFTLSIFEAVAAPFLKRYRQHRNALAFAFTWAVVGTLFLSVPSFKRSHYILSIMPAYCLLLAPVIERLFFGTLFAPARYVRLTCIALPVALAGGFVAGGFFVRHDFPTLLNAYIWATALTFIVWAAACWTFANGRRSTSLVLINVGVAVLLAEIWPAAGRHLQMNAGADALVAAFREHGITPDDEVILVAGRPDSSIEFYHGYRVERLIDEIEMTQIRRNRTDTSMDVYAEFLGRIKERLSKPRPVYMILSAENYLLLQANLPVRPREVFRLRGFHKDKAGGLVIITQGSATTAPTRTATRASTTQ